MSKTWKPINFLGSVYYDPRQEIRARTIRAKEVGDSMVAIPIPLAEALAYLHECDATVVSTGDEDGPMPPTTQRCRRPTGHEHHHFNGYMGWDDS